MKLNSKILLSTSSILAFTAESVFATGSDNDNAIIQLDKIMFELTVSRNKLGLVGFYSPEDKFYKSWGHDYEIAAKILKNRNIPVGLVNCDEHVDFCKEFGYNGSSFVSVFSDASNIYDFDEKYETKNFVQHIINKGGKDMSEFKTIEDIEKFISNSRKPVVVSYGNEGLKEKFQEIAAKNNERIVFAAIAKGGEGESMNVQDYLAVYPTGAETPIIYNGDVETLINNEDNFMNWVTFGTLPLVGELSEDNLHLYANLNVPVASFFYSDNVDKEIIMEKLESLAKEYKYRMVFLTTDAERYDSSLKNLNMKQQLPAFCIITPHDNKAYGFPQVDDEDYKKMSGRYAIDPKELENFISSFVAGEIPANEPSEIVHDEL
ncbi:hypothetical protein TPHA_0B04870 [Tetrapisispora phaffii CBS 4417]|uniref:protein disulfide-isomerase n=1 Tax=Tetrapisispora phaffii (strain ATCC 24235 / CBS 4417 / NBRC 1672 / NRRL Y-8282 / UCD 70-5) TaxID=1071381 RepID=G8BQ75_TETPH|nr:hypothetical protein TPHA_0B04870 [Tetrapisispora phaffii CBS 4417]CCE62156.1 hypothetical protein TPHA_0B04870 [Tetrapisispora phaffii CBS 4417]